LHRRFRHHHDHLTIQWFIDGRKNYKGPHIDEAALKNAQALGMQVDMPQDSDSGVRDEKAEEEDEIKQQSKVVCRASSS